jgi:hypothetical protein
MLAGKLTTGRWATFKGQIVIVNSLPGHRIGGNLTVPAGACEIHYVNERGDTTGADIVPIDALDTPTRAQIPTPRLANVHPEWTPGDPVRFVEGVSVAGADLPSGRASLEFVDDDTLATFPADHAGAQQERARRTGR